MRPRAVLCGLRCRDGGHDMNDQQSDKVELSIEDIDRARGWLTRFVKNQDAALVNALCDKAMLGVMSEIPSAQSAERASEREGFYEKLWKDFVSLQRGDAAGVCEKVECYYREQESAASATRDSILEEAALACEACDPMSGKPDTWEECAEAIRALKVARSEQGAEK